jgi:hypothetical protein
MEDQSLIDRLRERAEFEDKRVLDESKAMGFEPEVYTGSQTGALLSEAAAALEAAREDAWHTMDSCPVGQRVLLWNQETCEISIGYKPEDAPTHDAVVVGMSAAWADAWRPMPSEPEHETYDGPPKLSVVPAIDQARGKAGGEVGP